mmetsp:Transcript_25302/g.47215  ORF Transcript_25302/g.47215 Transcript_25302/m.47215 type:complete len:240 (+) Transcript_25302:22-741(+)
MFVRLKLHSALTTFFSDFSGSSASSPAPPTPTFSSTPTSTFASTASAARLSGLGRTGRRRVAEKTAREVARSKKPLPFALPIRFQNASCSNGLVHLTFAFACRFGPKRAGNLFGERRLPHRRHVAGLDRQRSLLGLHPPLQVKHAPCWQLRSWSRERRPGGRGSHLGHAVGTLVSGPFEISVRLGLQHENRLGLVRVRGQRQEAIAIERPEPIRSFQADCHPLAGCSPLVLRTGHVSVK